MYNDKKIFILGMARSGYEVAKLLSKHNNDITITDMKEQDPTQVAELINLGVKYVITNSPEDLLDDTFDVLIKNPGIIKTHPCVIKAKKLNIKVVNELEVAYTFLPKVKIVGITGSNGKTTTTTLIHEILKKGGIPVHLGGNIGFPLSSLVDKVKIGDTLVIEISDHQLIDMYDFKTDISILTNLYQNHLDFHGSYDAYKIVKKKIFNNHTNKDIAIINKGSNESLELTKDIISSKIYFSAGIKCECCIDGDYIVYNDEKIINTNDIKLQGLHNYENVMCAIIVAKQFNISNEIINSILTTFGGVEHRIEFVRTYKERDFYNDSKSTNVDSTIIALDSFKRPTILIMGGLDRGHLFDDLRGHMKNVKLIVCYGETKDRIKLWCDKHNIECIVKNTLIESTNEAWRVSKEKDIILLSPACASWDQYKRFEDRGDEFKAVVNNIK